jgi:cytidyltransferase-like protein
MGSNFSIDRIRSKIVQLDNISTYLDNLGSVVCTSGGFDPLHCGHVAHLEIARSHADCHVCIVNYDAFLENKKGAAFMPLFDRCHIVAALSSVDFVVPCYSSTVSDALRIIRPQIFAKGGDRRGPDTIPEFEVCQEIGTQIVTGVELDSFNRSSSEYLLRWKVGK